MKHRTGAYGWRAKRFSALQRAENSSMAITKTYSCAITRFQCSSASRKFLNIPARRYDPGRNPVSVLFSEPKIPQSNGQVGDEMWIIVSVLFSEPKIPQFISVNVMVGLLNPVSVLFSEPKIPQTRFVHLRAGRRWVSVLFSEPKIPQIRPSHLRPSIFPTAMITLRHS